MYYGQKTMIYRKQPKRAPSSTRALNQPEDNNMKKRSFLTSVAVIAAAMAFDVSASLPESLTEHLSANINPVVTATEISTTAAAFVLERPIPTANGQAKHSYHSSHASHSSHRSHYSSRY